MLFYVSYCFDMSHFVVLVFFAFRDLFRTHLFDVMCCVALGSVLFCCDLVRFALFVLFCFRLPCGLCPLRFLFCFVWV